MHKKSVAVYVEGQTEQIFVNRLIKELFDYQKIEIQNIKLFKNSDSASVVTNYRMDDPSFVRVFFLIIDIQGDQSLPSAIAARALRQMELGYEILALRDLYSGSEIKNIPETIENTRNEIREALKRLNFHRADQIEFFFAVQEIEAWLIPFGNALSRWANISEEEVRVKTRMEGPLEELHWPGKIVKALASRSGYTDHKSFKAMNSLISKIHLDEFYDVVRSSAIPSLTKFFDRLVRLREFAFQEHRE